ncbi:MAG: YeiH family protein [Actinomycetes bacterium]
MSVAMRRYLPGLVFALIVSFAGFNIHWRFDTISPLVASLAIGVIIGNIGIIPHSFAPGQKFASRKVLRFGIVLLGTQLAASQVIDLGGRELIVVLAVVVITFLGTLWLGPKLGVSKTLSLLIATGFSICGASAVAAMEGVVEAEEEEVTYSIALVTLCGSLAIVLLPLLRNFVGLQDAHQFGSWVGASVHDVAQVIATSSTGGKDAVTSATVVKLSRVVLLAPLVTMMAIWVKRGKSGFTAKASQSKVNFMPLFVFGFLVMIAVRTSGVIPSDWLLPLKKIEQWCLAIALVGLGSDVKISKLFKVGGKPLLLAAISWGAIAVVSLLGVHFVA